ncbi:transcriptional regulator, LacI family [Lachnospiraceae bacterium NK3A20]|nr:transcriptional regulator, LacI family [Lachnospiraceae bacterium NK3A20]
MNIYDIARMAGVSIATVSRVVNGSDKVSDKTKEKVLSVIEHAGYTPNVFAQGLGLNTMHTVGVLVPDISDRYMSSAVSFLEVMLHRNGYECILSCSGFELERKQSHVQMLLSKRIDALILVGSTYAGNGASTAQTDYIREAAAQVPVFVINGYVEGDNIYTAVCDDRNAVYGVTTSLIRQGHRKILFLTDSQSYSAQQKMAGYEAALTENSIPVRGNLKLRVARNNIYYVKDLLLEYSMLEFDSVIATEDAMACGALKYAEAKGLRVPEDLSVVGYNNSVISVATTPELTSVDSRIEDLCNETASNVLHVLNGDGQAKPRIEVPCRLRLRSSTDF